MSQSDAPYGPDPIIEAYKRDVDRTLIRENLRLSVEQRFVQLMAMQEFAEELRRAGREHEGKP
ncbi:MAG: hypothetical protein HYR55_16030 [Acidobacteria bacterium]|nr:hypothetical protein [Acidobacteriota bacterium]MBI3658656.1 hypothetical protein [Acidobacteriota bacterium]